jgi:hypothetical protein
MLCVTSFVCCHAGEPLALIDCCVRHASFQAADMLVAAELLLQQACCEPFLAAALDDPAAVTELASPLVGLMKRAAAFIKAACGLLEQQAALQGSDSCALEKEISEGPFDHHDAVSAKLFERAAACFPAVAHGLVDLVSHVADKVQQQLAAAGSYREPQQHHECSAEQGDCSSSSSSQSQASAALLAVLLARSAVVLADAMDTAAAAAGITPAQLFARWVRAALCQE